MTGNALVDLLLGKIVPSQPGGLSPQGIDQPADGTGFAELLGMLAGVSNDVTEGSSGDQNGLPIIDLLSADVSGDDVSEAKVGLVALNRGTRAALSGLMPIMETGLTGVQPVPEAVDKNTDSSVTIATSDQLPQRATNSMLLPKEAILPNPQVLALLNQIPVALPTGRFAVLSSKVTNGTLQMEVASQDTPNQTIKLSLPTALLHQTTTTQSNPAAATAAGIAGQPNAGIRIPLADPFAATERFDQLLVKVNVKEIEISPSRIGDSTGKTPSQVTVALIAESRGTPIVISGRMNRNQVVASIQRRPQAMGVAPDKGRPDPKFANSENPTGKSGETKSPTAVAVPSDDVTIESFSKSIEKSDGVGARMTGVESPMALSKSVRQARAASATTLDQPAVRMTLQQELPSLSQLEGRTIMLKLEPEYLGSARLHLTMRQDTLSARVLVETPQAKAAVESSLSQLTDQLTKAGIKIDYIDVGVRGGGAQNQFFHKQSNWFRAQNPQVALSRDVESISRDLSTATVPRPMVGYVAADRVNIYA